MGMDSTTRLAVAELAIYIIIFFISHYLIFKHGKHALEGWFFLLIFCVLRIIAAGLQIHNWEQEKKGKPTSTTASIINSIGVSALLLCCCGLIHEASSHEHNHQRKCGWIIVLLNHLTIATGIALAATGGASLTTAKTNTDKTSDQHLLIAGYFILLASMIAQLVYVAITLAKRSHTRVPAVRDARILVFGVGVALVVLLARVVSSIVFGFTLDSRLSPYTGTVAVKAVLVSLVQVVAVVVIVVVGWMSRNMDRESGRDGVVAVREAEMK